MNLPWPFLLWALALAAWILFLVFIIPQVLGFIVTRILSSFLGPESYIHIGSTYLTPIGGKLLFRNVIFANTEYCGRIAAGSLTLRWWPGRIRGFGEQDINGRKTPCRIALRLKGLEILWFNHIVPATPQNQQQQNASSESASGNIASAIGSMASVKKFKLPLLYRISPAIAVIVQVGAVFLGGPDLPTTTILSFARANGVHWVGPPSMEEDYYRKTTNIDFRSPKLKIVANPDWVPGQEICREPEERGVGCMKKSMKMLSNLCKDVYKSLQNDDTDQNNPEIRRQNQQAIPDGGPLKSKLKQSLYLDQDFALGNKVLLCKSAYVTYYEDIAGPATNKMANNTPFLPDMAPKWGMEIIARNSKVLYGPWAERQRALLFNFLFPYDYSVSKQHKEVEGRPRTYAEFKLVAKFEQKVELALPFRDPEKRPEPGKKSHEEISITCAGLSKLEFAFDLVNPTEHGYKGLFFADLTHCSVATSLNNKQLAVIDSLLISIAIKYPPEFNHVRKWGCKIIANTAQVFFLYDHIPLVMLLVNDLFASDREPTFLDGFYSSPSDVSVEFEANDVVAFMNVNEGNVITKPNDLDENVHYVATVPRLTGTISAPFIPYNSATRDISFEIKAHKGCLSLLLPIFNTNRQLFDATESNVSWRNTGNIPGIEPPQKVHGIPFVWVDTFNLKGSYFYYLAYGQDFLDTVTLDITGGPGDMQLFGFFLTYIINFQMNYLGMTQHVATVPGQTFPEEKPGNLTEVYLTVNVTGANVRLPVNLYRSKPYISGTVENLLLELRVMPAYLDLAINLTPVSLRLPIVTPEFEDPLCHFYDLKTKSQITISGFSFCLNYLFGPKPIAPSYHEVYKMRIGTVYGNCLPSQLLSLVSFGEHFLYHYDNKDNRALATIDAKNPIFVMFNLIVGSASLYLWSGNSITQLEAKNGVCVEVNTFVTHLHNVIAKISLPKLVFRQFSPNDSVYPSYTDIKDWTEVGSIRCSFVISISMKDPTWQEDIVKQQTYLQKQDSETHRLRFLWENLETSSPATQQLKNPSPRINVFAAPEESTSSTQQQPIRFGKSNSTLDIPHEDNRLSASRASISFGESARSLTKVKISPRNGSGESVEVVAAAVSAIVDATSGVTEDDADFQTAKSNISSQDDEEIASDIDQQEETVATIPVQSTNRNPTVVNEQKKATDENDEERTATSQDKAHEGISHVKTNHLILQSPLVGHFDFNEGMEPFAIQSTISCDAFIPRGNAAVSFNSQKESNSSATLNPQKSSFTYLTDQMPSRSALKSSDSASNRPGKEKKRRHKAHKATEKVSTMRSELNTLHQSVASTVTIVIDSLSDVSILATPLSVNAISNLINSLLMKIYSPDELIDAFQLSTISKAFPTAKFAHERVQVVASFESLTLRTFNIENQQELEKGGSSVIVSKAKGNKARLYFSVCKKYSIQEDGHSNSKTSSPRHHESASGVLSIVDGDVPKEELCSVVGSFEIDSATCVLSSIPIEQAEKKLSGRILYNSSIDELLGDEGEKDILLSLGNINAMICSRNTPAGNTPEQDFNVSFEDVSLRASNDMGYSLSTAAIPWVDPLSKLASKLADFSTKNENLTKLLILDALKSQLNPSLQQQQAEQNSTFQNISAITEVFSLTTSSAIHRRCWRELALLRSFIGSNFESNSLKQQPQVIKISEPEIRSAYKEIEEKISSGSWDSSSGVQLQAIPRSPPLIALFLTKPYLLRASVDFNARVSITNVMAVFVKQHFETKFALREISVLLNVLSQQDSPQKVTLALLIDDTSINFGPSVFGIVQGFMSFAEDLKKVQRSTSQNPAVSAVSAFVPRRLDAKLSLSSLKCHVASSEFGTLLVNVRSGCVSHCVFTDETANPGHSTVGSLSLISLDLADSATVSSSKGTSTAMPCLQLAVKDVFIGETLSQIKTQVSPICDIAVRVESVDAGFTVSEKFLAKLQGFIKEWSSSVKVAISSISTPKLKEETESKSDTPLLSCSLDLCSVRLGSDIIPSLPFKYEAARSFLILSQSSSEYGEAVIQLMDHRLVFTPTPQSASTPTKSFVLPSLRAFAQLEHPPESVSKIDGKIEVGAWKNVIDVELINNILALQWRMNREIDDMLEAWMKFQARKKAKERKASSTSSEETSRKIPSTTTSPFESVLSRLHWKAELDFKGFDIEAISPAATAVLRSGNVKLRLQDAPPSPGTFIPFSWRIDMTGFTVSLLDQHKPIDAWANIQSDVSLWNFANSEIERPTKNHDSLWLTISRAEIILQLGALERGASLWLHYLSAIVDFKERLGSLMKVDKKKIIQAIDTVDHPTTDDLSQHSISLEVQVDDFVLKTPFKLPLEQSPGIAIGLRNLQLLGSLSKSFVCDFSKVKQTATARKILGSCTFEGAFFYFTDDSSEKFNPQKRPANCSFVEKGNCSLVVVVSTLFSIISAEFESVGASVSVNAELIRLIKAFIFAISENQQRLMQVVDSVSKKQLQGQDPQPQPQPQPVKATPQQQYGVVLDFKLFCKPGNIVVNRLPKESSASTFLYPPPPNRSSISAESLNTILPSLDFAINFNFLPPDEIENSNGAYQTKVDFSVFVGDSNVVLSPVLSVIVEEVAQQLGSKEFSKKPAASSTLSLQSTEDITRPIDQHPSQVRANALVKIGSVRVELNCAPLSDVICQLSLDPIDSFCSFSLHPQPIIAALVNIPLVVLKVHHVQFPEQSTWLKATCTTFNYTNALHPLNVALGYIGDISFGLIIDRLHEFAEFYKLWLLPLIESQQKQQQQQQQQVLQQTTSSQDKKITFPLNVILDFGISSISTDLELGQWIGNVKLEAKRLGFGLGIVVHSDNSTGVSNICSLEQISIGSHGKLSGTAKLESIFARMEIDGSKPSCESFAKFNPIEIYLEYAMIPVLAFRSGGLTMTLLAKESNLPTSSRVEISGCSLQFCPETIATAITIFKKISETLSDQLSLISTTKRKKVKPLSSTPLVSSMIRNTMVPCNGDIGVKATNIDIWFSEGLRESRWFAFTIKSCAMALKVVEERQKEDQNVILTRDLVINASETCISIDSEKKKKTKKHSSSSSSSSYLMPSIEQQWKRTKTEMKIVEMPSGKLVMRTLQKKVDNLDFWFETAFEQPIFVSLDISHYSQLRELVEQFKTRILDEQSRLSSINSISTTTTTTTTTIQKRMITFNQQSFVLEPVLSVLSDLTPSVTSVLGWVGIESPSTSIPSTFHVFLTEPLEHPLRRIGSIWVSLASKFGTSISHH